MTKKMRPQITVTEKQTPYGVRRSYDGGRPGLHYAEYLPTGRGPSPTKSRSFTARRVAKTARRVTFELLIEILAGS